LSEKPENLLNPPQTIRAVLCYLKDGENYLLLLKAKDRFGGGFWNSPGGKIEPNESAVDAAKREVLEETGIAIRSLERVGSLSFYFGHGKSRPDWTAEVFISSDFHGTRKASAEGELRWFKSSEFPYDSMWEDDRYWIPLMIRGEKFHGAFEFTEDSKKLVTYKISKESP
jgi:8-oxo-dGTP diphosphatase